MGATYVNTPGDPIWALPAACRGLEMHGFGLFSQRPERLQAMCEARLNRPMGRPGLFQPLRLTLLTFGRYERAYAFDDPEFARRGYITYAEVALWNFLVATEDIPGRLLRGSLAVFVPWIFVDNSYAAAGGRELLGIPKKMGAISMPASPSEQAPYTLETLAFPTYTPETKAVPMKLIEVERVQAGLGGEVSRAWKGLSDAVVGLARAGLSLPEGAADLRRLLPAVGLRDLGSAGLDAVRALSGGGIPTVALKQFRSSVSSEEACHQSVQLFTAPVPRLEGGLLGGRHRIRFLPCASDPIVEELGLAEESETRLAFRANLDLDLVNTTQLWP